MANTTWNNSDKYNNITLSGTNNLTITAGLVGGAIRTIDRLGSGKYYFEYTMTTLGGTTAVGVANGAANLSTVSGTPANVAAFFCNTGVVWVNNVNTGVNFGARASGDVIGVALDLDNKLIWFRVAPSGNWNNNAGYSPGGTGGQSIAAISPDSRLLPLYGLYVTNNNGSVSTANFGDSAFSGAVPSGYTSGFTSGLSPALSATATQVGLEMWAQGTPNALLTQVGVEMWGSVPAVTVQALMTQIAMEQWASTGLGGVTPQARAMILA